MRFRFARYLPIAFGWLVKRRIDLRRRGLLHLPRRRDPRRGGRHQEVHPRDRQGGPQPGGRPPRRVRQAGADRVVARGQAVQARARRAPGGGPAERAAGVDRRRPHVLDGGQPGAAVRGDRGLRAGAGHAPHERNGREAFVARFTAGWAGGRDALAREMEGHVARTCCSPSRWRRRRAGSPGSTASSSGCSGRSRTSPGEVHAWEPTDDGVMIDMTFHGTLRRPPLRAAQPRPDRAPRRPPGRAPRRLRPLGVAGRAFGTPAPRRDRRPSLAALAAGRIVLGVLSRVSPRATARGVRRERCRDTRSSTT